MRRYSIHIAYCYTQVIRQWPGFSPRSSHTKDSKMVLDATLLYKERIKGKVKQSRERRSALPYTSA